MPPGLHAEHLSLWRGERHVLSGLDLTTRAGELLQVSGANGTGKTTLLRTLCGLMHLEEGRILWQGRNIGEDLPAYHAQLVYLGHEPPLKGDLTATENLMFWVGMRHLVSCEEINAVLERVGARGWSEQPLRTLSAGQKRRVALAGVVLFGATLWFLDEPTTNLDAEGQRLVGALIEERIASGGIVIAAVHQELPVRSVAARRLELACP